jgi:hypothetical protein
MLQFDDIQHILLTRAPALTGRYEFLSFQDGPGRAWLSAIKEKVHSAAAMRASVEADKRWVTVAFTWNGLRALGLDEASLASFPEEFKQGMAARAEALGDVGANAPEHWVGGLADPKLHAIAILFARDSTEHARCVSEHEKLVAACPGVEILSVLDLKAVPPFDYAHDHFGYRDRLSQPVIEGTASCRRPAPERRSSQANSSLGTRTKTGRPPICRNPKSCPGTAATWRIAAFRSMWADFVISCASTARPVRNKS